MKKSSAFSLIELSIVILIIGILIAGITQSSRLISAMRLASARQATQSSPVSSIRGLIMWLESTSENSFATGTTSFTNVSDLDDAVAIGRWNDINPQVTEADKNHVLQSTSANQPTYALNAINSLPAVRFDGNNDTLSSENSSVPGSGLSATGKAYSIFAVARSSQTTPSGAAITGTSLQGGLGGFVFTSGKYGATSANVAYLGNTLRSTTTLSGSQNYILYLGFSDTNDTLAFRTNGADDGSTTSATQTLSGNGKILIGSEQSSANYWNGFIGEIIIFDRVLKNEEITSIEKYLSKKWGIKI